MSGISLFLNYLKVNLRLIDKRLCTALGFPEFHNNFDVIWNDDPRTHSDFNEDSPKILDSIIDGGFLWAVPKSRRSIERRLTRKWAVEKRLKPKRNLLICNVCGHYHEAHTICGNCYEKVKNETEAMQEAIQKELKLDPVDKEVVVLYKEEKEAPELYKGKRIVEIEKERPAWFSKNLLSKSNIVKSPLRYQKPSE